MDEPIDEKREAFEGWFSGGWEHPQAVERSGEGYALLFTDNAWQVWDVAWKAARLYRLKEGMMRTAVGEG